MLSFSQKLQMLDKYQLQDIRTVLHKEELALEDDIKWLQSGPEKIIADLLADKRRTKTYNWK